MKPYIKVHPWLILLLSSLFVVMITRCHCYGSTIPKASVRIKDIVSWQGVRANVLVGYGLIVGLKGTGDTLKNSPYAMETVVGMLERLGVNVRDKVGDMKSQNMAAVMVTAELPAFSRQGMRLDVSVSAMGTAKDLSGGMLLVTPLQGADSHVYAVAQGPVVTGGFQAQGQTGSSITRGVPTSGRVTNGAIVERETGFELNALSEINLTLTNPDFTTAHRIADVINQSMGPKTASPKDHTTVALKVPARFRNNTMAFITTLEQLRVIPDQSAKIIIDENNGIIVMGQDVRISAVAVSYGNLTIQVKELPLISQPNPFTNAAAVAAQVTALGVDEGAGQKMTVLQEGVTLQQLVDNLNALGVSPRDMISILRTIKASGALQAEIGVI